MGWTWGHLVATCAHLPVPQHPAGAKLTTAGVVLAVDTMAAPHIEPRRWFLGSWWHLHHFAVISCLPWDGVQLFILQDSPFCNPDDDAPTQVPLCCHCPQHGHRRCDSPSAGANPALETQILEPPQTWCRFLKGFPATGSISLKTCRQQTSFLQPPRLMGTPDKYFLGGDSDGVHRRPCSYWPSRAAAGADSLNN